MRGWPALAVFSALALAACGESDSGSTADGSGEDAADAGDQGPVEVLCPHGSIEQAAYGKAGMVDEKSALLPNGRLIRPAGAIVPLTDMAMGLALDNAGRYAYVLHAEERDEWPGVWVVDLHAEGGPAVVSKATDVQGYHGITLSPDGETLYVAGLSTGQLHRFDVGVDGTLTAAEPVQVGNSLVDVEVSADGATAWVLSNASSWIYEVSLPDGAVQARMKGGTNPYALAVDETRGRIFASNLAGGTVSAVDLASAETLALIPVGKNPEGMALDATRGRLYVANSDSDSVSVIDAASLEVLDTWDLTGNDLRLAGGALNALWIDSAGARLYAALARRNNVKVLDATNGQILGAIPTGHYPVAVRLTPDEKTLVTVSAKGWGSAKSNLGSTPGQLNVLELPTSAEDLEALTAEVTENNGRPRDFYPPQCVNEGLPPALAGGPDKPVNHVVLIIKENKTYDTLLGDDPSVGDGDPALCLFPEAVTPNTHRLARQFTNFDNFYSDPERSIQGHLWTTGADCNDYVEKIHQIQFALYGYEPATIPETGTIFDHCLLNGVSFRNYGEFPGFGYHLMDDFEPFVDHKYPFWTMSVPDVEKASEFIRELDEGIFPEFVYIVLPNDHTFGGRDGAPDPTWMVADNDAGLGMIIEAISHSVFWPETAIFVIEDDPQGPPDHVHSHRSLCMAISPFVRRGYVSSVHNSIPSLYATIERLLELPPLNRNTLEAPPMVDIFITAAEKPDFTPYDARPNTVEYSENPADTPAADASAAMDFSAPDRAPGLAMVLWRMLKGDQPIPPYARYIDE